MKQFKKSLAVFLVFMLLGGILAACSNNNKTNGQNTPANSETNGQNESGNNDAATSGGPKDGGTFTFSSFSDIVSVNPIFIQDTASSDAAHFLLAYLYDLDRNGNVTVEPWSLAAELPEISEDGLTYTIKLKDYAKWSDGTPVTADDIVFSINAAKNPETGSPLISSFDQVDTVTKIDNYTVEVKMKKVYAPFLYSLVFQPAPAHILKDVPVKELKTHPYGTNVEQTVTNGPWKWVEWTQTQQLVFEKDPNYWGEVKPHIDQIVYKIYADQNTEVQALIKGDVDLVQAIPVVQLEAVKKNKDITVIEEPGPQYEFVAFNFNPDNWTDGFVPFASQKTRQAIAHALDRDGMIENVLKGTGLPINAPFLPGTWADPGDRATSYAYDPEKAKQLLAEDGWVMNEATGILEKDGHPFSFELQYNAGNSRREQVAQIIQSNLAEVGIEVKPVGIDFSAWVDQNLTPGKFQAVLLGWSLTTPDPASNESLFSSKFFPPDGQNMGWYVNKELDQLWVEGYSTTDMEERAEIYAQTAEILSTDLPYVFLYQYGTPYGIGPRVHYEEEHAPEPSLATGYFFHIIHWWVE